MPDRIDSILQRLADLEAKVANLEKRTATEEKAPIPFLLLEREINRIVEEKLKVKEEAGLNTSPSALYVTPDDIATKEDKPKPRRRTRKKTE